jgi:hypothetical protein
MTQDCEAASKDEGEEWIVQLEVWQRRAGPAKSRRPPTPASIYDHDPKIAFAAVRAAAILEHTLLDQLSNTDNKTNPDLSAETVEVLAETIAENNPTSPRFVAGPLSDDRPDGRLIAVTEFMSNILALLRWEWHPTRQDIEDIKSTLEELCRDLHGRDFSPATQEHFVDVLCDTWRAHLASASTGMLFPQFSLESRTFG